tara:strand:+ start:2221 stop:2541 length:321 start_codon:yes stop_codon:yes gene_type:complete
MTSCSNKNSCNVNKPFISTIGWFTISTTENDQLIKSIVHDYKRHPKDVIIIHPTAYYFDTNFIGNDYSYENSGKEFTFSNWKTVSILENMKSHLAYWILIERYNRT